MMCKSDYVLKIYLIIKRGKKFSLFLRLQTLQKIKSENIKGPEEISIVLMLMFILKSVVVLRQE